MAELLIVIVAVVVLLLYAADRARKLRVRARQMSAMNDRLDVAAAKVDAQQQKKRAVVRASAELTSVLPAIKRPPLTIPGMAGHGDHPEEGVPEEGVPGGEAALETAQPAEHAPSAEGSAPAREDPPAEDSRPAGDAPSAWETLPAGEALPAEETGAGEARDPEPGENTLSMPAGVTADEVPVLKPQVTAESTLIMPPVPDQGPVPAGEALPAPGPDAQRAHR